MIDMYHMDIGVLKDTIILENMLSEVSFLFAHTNMDLEY